MSFRTKTILGIAAIEAVLLTLLVWSGLRFIEQSAEREFTERARATATSFAVTTKDALISADLASLNSFVEESLRYPGVLYAKVLDVDERILARAGDESLIGRVFVADSDFPSVDDGVYDIEQTISEASMAFGRIQIGISTAGLEAVEERARRYGVGIALLEMLLVALFSLALGTYLTRQLGNLAEASRRIAAGERGYQISVKGSDELAQVARAFNQMSESVRDSYTRIEERESQLRGVLESILDGIVTVDRQGTILAMNPGAESLFDVSAGELVGQCVDVLFEPDARHGVNSILGGDDAERLGELFECYARSSDGKPIIVEARITASDRNLADTFIIVLRNIEERLQSESELRLRERIIQASASGVVIADATRSDYAITYVNPAFERITGYCSDEVVGRNCRFLSGEGTDPRERARLRDAINARQEVNVILRNYRKDGTGFWNDLYVTPIHDRKGDVSHFFAIQTDISERIDAQIQLEKSEDYLRRVLNTTHDGIIVIDEEGTVESFNTGAQAMFGYKADEVLGRNVSMLVPEPYQSSHDEYLKRYHASGEAHILGSEREFDIKRKDGTSLTIALRVNSMDSAGERRYIGVIHDITERKHVEDTLRDAKIAAEAAVDAKSEFLANMSHEIRTPMHGVLASLEMLRGSAPNPPQRRYIETATSSAELLLSIIEEILDFSRIEAGKLHIETLDFELRRAVEDVTAMLGERAHSKGLELVCYVAPEVPDTLQGDPIRLRQILINLIGNALKFTEHGEVVVSVTLESKELDVATLCIEVRDTGVGIALDKQARLFQPFVQADSSTSRKYGGTGLGLSISKRLVELMGGEIGFESVPEQGSRFWFRLPFALGVHDSAGQRPNFSEHRVLIVDDNATNRIILHRYLTAWGGQSGSAAGGREALAKLQDAAIAGRSYDLVLLDLNMPDVDGIEMLRELRADPLLADMPIIMLSSSAMDVQVSEELAIDIWLDKPVRQSDLQDAIATVFRRAAVRVPASPAASAAAIQFADERVLLVEDNPTTQTLAVEMLSARGLQVVLAEDGARAVELMQSEDFAIVLMDVQMPIMDGYEATRRIRQFEQTEHRPHTPIIAVTAHALPEDKEKAAAAGMDDYLVKPFTSTALTTLVARWLMPPAAVANAGEDRSVTLIDNSVIEEVRAIMGTRFSELLEKFIASSLKQLDAARIAVERSQPESIRDAVHALKNSAGDIGAIHMRALASELERAVIENPTVEVDLAALDSACQRTIESVQDILTRERA